MTQIWHVYGGLGTCASVGTVKQKFTLLKTQILAKCLNIVEVTNEKNNHFNSSTVGMYQYRLSKDSACMMWIDEICHCRGNAFKTIWWPEPVSEEAMLEACEPRGW